MVRNLDRSTRREKTTTTAQESGYLSVDDLEMYYEVHGTGQPLVLLHGAFSAIGTSFSELLPRLAEGRQVIGLELQAHGRTADIDRALSMESMADDVAAAIRQLRINPTDLLGYSMGAGVATRVAINEPDVVRKLILISGAIAMSGIHEGLMEGLSEMTPEMMHGSPWHEEYLRIAPDPGHFAEFFAKKTEMDLNTKDLPSEDFASIKAPTLIVIGDSDLTRPEHAVEMFRLLGGGVFGDTPAGLPDSQLAVIPGASHVSVVSRPEVLVPVINSFLDAPMPASKT